MIQHHWCRTLGQDTSITKLYTALSHPVRRQIVDLLKTRGRAGFKELHDQVKISVGALYHHLEALEGLVGQGPDKKYFLRDQARSALDALSVSEEKITTGTLQPELAETRLVSLAKEALFGRSVFHYLNHESLRSLPLAILIVAFGGWVSAQANLEPLLLFYLNPTTTMNHTLLMLLFPLGWLATFTIIEALTLAIFKRRGGEVSLLNGTAFAMLPLLIVPGILLLAQYLSYPVKTQNLLIIALPIILQVWVICLLSSAISTSKGLRVEKTALISLGVVYLNIIALVATLQLGIF